VKLADLIDVKQDVDQHTPTRHHHPTGWEPGIDTAAGVVVVKGGDTPPSDWDAILTEFRLDPTAWEVVSDRVHVRTWDTHDGRAFYYKADVRPRQQHADRTDLDELCRQIAKHRYRRPDPVDVDDALVVCLADWQTGPDPEGLVAQVLELKTAVVQRLKQSKPAALYVIGMGDMIESCDGHYALQTYATGAGGLNGRRDQIKLVRRLLVDLLTTWARYCPTMVVGAVPGNHGENRQSGKAFTTFEDNADLEVFEQAGEVLAANPDAYGHVRFVLPDGDMALTLDVAGTVVTFIHGHQARRGGTTPQQKLSAWWKGKQNARHPAGDADVLVNGHYHHLSLIQDGPRTWMQCPALAQSRWWEETGGAPTAAGTLSFTVSGGGWDNLKVL
jgi:predicted phosphodiesterase